VTHTDDKDLIESYCRGLALANAVDVAGVANVADDVVGLDADRL
jgi:hypothetical protein